MASRLTELADELSLDDLKRLLLVKEKMTVLEGRRAKLAAELEDIDAELAELRRGVTGSRAGRRTAKRTSTRKPSRARKAGTVAGTVEELIRAAGRAMSFKEIHDTIVEGGLVATKSKNFANVLRRTLSTSDAFVRVDRGVYGIPGVTKAAGAKKAPAKKVTKKAGRKTAKKAGKKTAKKAGKKTTKKAARKASGKKTAAKKAPATRGGRKAGTLEDVVVALLRKEGGPLSFQDLLKRIVDGKLFKSKAKDFSNVLRRTLSTSDKVKRQGRGVYTLA